MSCDLMNNNKTTMNNRKTALLQMFVIFYPGQASKGCYKYNMSTHTYVFPKDSCYFLFALRTLCPVIHLQLALLNRH